jgi:hypothetical protein
VLEHFKAGTKEEKNVAVFVAWETLKQEQASGLGSEEPLDIRVIKETASRYGRLALVRAYGDWADPEAQLGLDANYLYRAGIEPVYVPGRSHPRATERSTEGQETRLFADAIATAYQNPMLDVFLFIGVSEQVHHILPALREAGKRILLLDLKESVRESRESRENREGVVTGLTSGMTETNDLPTLAQIAETLREVVERRREEGLNTPFTFLGAHLRHRFPGFRHEAYGAERFADLMERVAVLGNFQIIPLGNMRYVVNRGETLLEEPFSEDEDEGDPATIVAQNREAFEQLLQTLARLRRQLSYVTEYRLTGALQRLEESALPAGQWRRCIQWAKRFELIAVHFHGAELKEDLRINLDHAFVAGIEWEEDDDDAPVANDIPLDPFNYDGNFLSEHGAVIVDLIQTLTELESRYPYVTLTKLAQSLWNKGHRDPRALPPNITPVSARTRQLDMESLFACVEWAIVNAYLSEENEENQDTRNIRPGARAKELLRKYPPATPPTPSITATTATVMPTVASAVSAVGVAPNVPPAKSRVEAKSPGYPDYADVIAAYKLLEAEDERATLLKLSRVLTEEGIPAADAKARVEQAREAGVLVRAAGSNARTEYLGLGEK